MSRLRRVRREVHSIPAAAEVLEARSLLSGAAAAVHSAAHHALTAEHAPGAAPDAGKPIALPFDVTVQFTSLFPIGGPPVQTPGVVTITPVSATVGSRVTATVSAAVTILGNPALVGLSVKGKVLSSSSNGSTTTVHLVPTGTLRLTFSAGARNLSRTLRAIAPMTITLDNQGKFTLLETAVKLPSDHGKPPPPFDFLAYTA
jgi:hypothetical protein